MAAELPRRVLLTADTLGGVLGYALEVGAALAQADIDVVLATMGGALRPEQWASVTPVDRVRIHESRFRLEWMEEPWAEVDRAGAWLLDLERTFRPDVVHLNQFAFGALPFAAPKIVVAHSCVLSWWHAVHGEAAPESWDRYREAVERGLDGADLVVAPTAAMLATLQENYGFAGEARVIPNGRSAETWFPSAKKPFVLSAGRLWDDAKNLRALEAIAADLPWPVRVAGPLARPNFTERPTRGVQVLGELSAATLRSELARAAIYALPARYEPFGLSALEAALCGCALVLGDIPSLREVWGDAALFVAPEDSQALRAALLRFIDDAPLRERMACAARERAMRYTPERMAHGYLDAYADALDRRVSSGITRPQPPSKEQRACAS